MLKMFLMYKMCTDLCVSSIMLIHEGPGIYTYILSEKNTACDLICCLIRIDVMELCKSWVKLLTFVECVLLRQDL